MPDTDRILEAEQSIQSIASELKRMRDAANLLESSQAQVDVVLASAQRVIQATEQFSSNCGIIVTKLAATDLNQSLGNIRTDIGLIATLVEERTKGTNAVIANFESQLRNLENQLQIVAKGSKGRQIATIVFVILTFVAALFILAEALVPSLGG